MDKKENFEELMKRLDEITSKLEKDDNLSLDESINLFKEGMEISNKCNKQIEEAEKQISILVNHNGELIEENFIPNEDE